MLAQRRRRWANINPALDIHVVFAGYMPKYVEDSTSVQRQKAVTFTSEVSSYFILALIARHSCTRSDPIPMIQLSECEPFANWIRKMVSEISFLPQSIPQMSA